MYNNQSSKNTVQYTKFGSIPSPLHHLIHETTAADPLNLRAGMLSYALGCQIKHCMAVASFNGPRGAGITCPRQELSSTPYTATSTLRFRATLRTVGRPALVLPNAYYVDQRGRGRSTSLQ